MIENGPSIPVDGRFTKSDFSDHQGVVSALSLPAGKYYMFPKITNPYIKGIEIPEFEFEVIPGETTYLGQLYMEQSCMLINRFLVRDQYTRDVELASRQSPYFAKTQVIKRLFNPQSDHRRMLKRDG